MNILIVKCSSVLLCLVFLRFLWPHNRCSNWDNSVGILTRLRAGRPWNRCSIPERSTRFSGHQNVQTDSGTYPSLLLIGHLGVFPGGRVSAAILVGPVWLQGLYKDNFTFISTFLWHRKTHFFRSVEMFHTSIISDMSFGSIILTLSTSCSIAVSVCVSVQKQQLEYQDVKKKCLFPVIHNKHEI